jgi:electron transfer flavoprotein alpha subunit
MTEIWVLAECSAGGVEPVSFELLGEARRLARKLDVRVAALVLGDHVESTADVLAHYGAETVFVIQDDRLRHYDPELFVASIGELCVLHRPKLILFPATSTGGDVAVRLSASHNWPLVPRCVQFRVHNGEIEMIRTFAYHKIHGAMTGPGEGPRLASVAPETLGLDRPDPESRAKVVFAPAIEPEQRQIDMCGFIPGNPRELDLREAEIVIAVGRGLGSRENLRLVEDLADVLGASIGCTRAVVDLEWLTHSAQIGQTGTTVKPKLYLACGISGATQHTVGMKDANTILAVNTDRSAPIFKIADLGLVADVNQILPILIEQCRKACEGP